MSNMLTHYLLDFGDFLKLASTVKIQSALCEDVLSVKRIIVALKISVVKILGTIAGVYTEECKEEQQTK